MIGRGHALRAVNQALRPALGNLSRSTSLVLFDHQKPQNRDIHTTNRLQFNLIKSYWYDFTMKIKEMTFRGTKIQEATVYMLESAIDNVDYMEWFRYFELDDTIGSWYLVTLLHNWMILVKISEPGKTSEYFKRQFIQRTQFDLKQRVSRMGIFSNKDKNLFFYDCHYAMNGAIISYDEGLINGDRELAAALWRTFFQKKCSDYRKLEVLVHYVRVQLQHLATIKNEDLYNNHIQWVPFNFPKAAK